MFAFGMDLGTSSVLLYRQGKGVVLREPSVVAVRRRSGQVVSTGKRARDLLGRTPEDVLAVRPVRGGVITDCEMAGAMARAMLRRAGCGGVFRPQLLVCVPPLVSEWEERAVIDAGMQAGASRVYLMEQPVAAAAGAGVDPHSPRGTLVVDIGGGTTDIAVISFGSVVLSDSIRVAGDKFDEALVRYMKRKHDLAIGERSAEDIKIAYGRAHIEKEQQIVEIRGRSLLTGLPESVPVATNELVDATAEPLRQIMERVRGLFEQTPPELAADITETGICLTGGGAQLRGLDRYLAEHTGVPCRLAEDPVSCVAIGTGKVLEDFAAYAGAIQDYRRGEFARA